MTENTGVETRLVDLIRRSVRLAALRGLTVDYIRLNYTERNTLAGELGLDLINGLELEGVKIRIDTNLLTPFELTYRTGPAASPKPAGQNGRERVAQIILKEINRQCTVEWPELEVWSPVGLKVGVHGPIDLGAIVDALVAAAPPEIPIYSLAEIYEAAIRAPRIKITDHRADNGELPHPSTGERP